MADDQDCGEQQPEAAEQPPPRKPRIRDAAKAALQRGPSRPQDQAIFWAITTTKELGFPVVAAFLLMYGGWKLFNRSIDTQDAGVAKLTEAMKEMASAQRDSTETQAESNEITRALMTEIGLRAPPRRRATPRDAARGGK